MNFLYDLPDDIQDKIFKFSHEMKFKNVLLYIRRKQHWWIKRRGQGLLYKLYNSEMSMKELDYYFKSLDFLYKRILIEKY
jgi:hypothetical protein